MKACVHTQIKGKRMIITNIYHAIMSLLCTCNALSDLNDLTRLSPQELYGDFKPIFRSEQHDRKFK